MGNQGTCAESIHRHSRRCQLTSRSHTKLARCRLIRRSSRNFEWWYERGAMPCLAHSEGWHGHRTTHRKTEKTIWRFSSGARKMVIGNGGGGYRQLANCTDSNLSMLSTPGHAGQRLRPWRRASVRMNDTEVSAGLVAPKIIQSSAHGVNGLVSMIWIPCRAC